MEYFSHDIKITKFESERKIENLYPFIIRRPDEDELVNSIWLDYRLNYRYEFNSFLLFRSFEIARVSKCEKRRRGGEGRTSMEWKLNDDNRDGVV